MTDTLEWRMYAFVPYNLSPNQQAIQAGHAIEQYAYKYKNDVKYINYIKNHKTWIILNGGTTNNNFDEKEPGHLGYIKYVLDRLSYPYETFNEPDLNNALTAVCFLVSEQVFNYIDYPDIAIFAKSQFDESDRIKYLEFFKNGPFTYDDVKNSFPVLYNKWVTLMGGQNNIELRELLRGKKLA